MSDLAPFDPGFEHRTLGGILRARAERSGDRPWLLVEDERLSFAQVDGSVDRLAAGLAGIGVERGDRVAVMLGSAPRFVVLGLALGRLGAVLVPVNLALRGATLRHVLAQSGAIACVVDEHHLDRALEAIRELPRVRTLVVAGQERLPAVPGVRVHDLGCLEATETGTLPASAAGTFDPWCVMFTSGTTGPAKGAVMSHHYWYLGPASLSGPARDVRADDVFLVSSPLYHAASWLVQLLPALLLGLPCALEAGFSASRFWDRVRHFGATQLLTMGATHLWLWNQEPTARDADHPGRVWAPVPLPPALHDPFRRRFGIEHLWSTYGGTEFMNVVCTDVRRPTKPGTTGRAREGVELAVLDERGRRLPPGTVGELCVRPRVPHAIFQGYVEMPDETLRRLDDLWYHTGDLVTIDADGDLTFVDRKDDYLRVRGENVSSFEVETAFARHPDVAEAAAFAVRSAESALVAEDEVMIALVPTEGASLDLEEALRTAAADLPHFAVPRYLDVVDDLPRTPTGRVRKHVLRDRGVTPTTLDRVRAGIGVER